MEMEAATQGRWVVPVRGPVRGSSPLSGDFYPALILSWEHGIQGKKDRVSTSSQSVAGGRDSKSAFHMLRQMP